MRASSVLIILLTVVCVFTGIQAQTFESGRFYVRLKNGVSHEKFITKAITNNSACITKISEPFCKVNVSSEAGDNLSRTLYVETDNDYCLSELFDKIKNYEEVEFCERIPMIDLLFHPDDSLYVDNILGANPKWLFDLIGAEQAWDYQTGNPEISVAIIDNAIWTDHPDLQGKFVDIWDFADNDSSTIPATSANTATGRQWSHGTHVTGLVGAITNNNRGVASIGFNISLRAYKMYSLQFGLPYPNLNAGIQAITHAVDDGANVINISWGTTNQMQTLLDATEYAYNNNVVVVAAAGNNGAEEMYYPAAHPHVIAVTAVGMDDKISSFSNYGTFVDLTSPGGYGPNDLSTSTWSPVSTTYHNAYSWAQIIGAVKYDGKVGTSMASPVVAGLCGLILSADSTFTPDEVEQILKITSTDISALNPTFIGKIGTGRIHAGNALEYVYTQLKMNESVIGNSTLVYPNPCDNYLYFSSANQTKAAWKILNSEGKIMLSGNSGFEEIHAINTSGLSNGLYFLQITDDKGMVNKKFVIGRN